MPHKLLGLSGALRSGSTNRLLLREAARLYDAADYVEADLNLPLYDGDLESESGLPEGVNRLVAQIAEADALLISTPEYNAGVTGVLKNALDWISRHPEKPMVGKPTAVMSAAAGRAGGVRAQMMLRDCLVAFRPRIALGSELGLANSSHEFDAEGRLTRDHYTASLRALMEALKSEVSRAQ